MELKKKTIIWEDNNEPPKDYIWIKSDGKAYEFDYNDRKWKESTSINVNNNGSDDDSSGGGSTEIDYEAIYQFYKKKLVEGIIPEQDLEQAIIPEHVNDIEDGDGNIEEYIDKFGIWSGTGRKGDVLLFNNIDMPENKFIYFGKYHMTDSPK